jgi:hypothetical protein
MKVRKLALVVAAACTWSAAAFATFQETTGTLTTGGQPIPGQSVKIVKVKITQPAKPSVTRQPSTSEVGQRPPNCDPSEWAQA